MNSPYATQSNRRKSALIDSFKLAKRQYQFLLMLILPLAYMIVFHYIPMYGVQIAFRKFTASKGILGSEWVGLYHFRRFFNSPQFGSLLLNTVRLSFTNLILSFPIPVLMALGLNATRNRMFKKVVQTGYYIPHFISLVVVIGMLKQMLTLRFGIVNQIIEAFGRPSVNFMGSPAWFPYLYAFTGIWQNAGYTSIIYLAALTAIDPELYDAARVDGASRFRQIIHIELPGVLPSACLMLILNTGKMINVGFEKVFLMQTTLNLRASEVLSTYIYKVGIASASSLPNYSFGAAVGLFNSVVSLLLVLTVNKIVDKMGGSSLW